MYRCLLLFILGLLTTIPTCIWAQTSCQSQCGGPGEPVPPCGNPCPNNYVQEGQCCCQQSPIVIDSMGQGFHLTSVKNGVLFKAKADAAPAQISWTDSRWHNGWLALDRNGNGRIDDMTELFGNFTEQPPSSNRNGFAALAVFDKAENGGNENGFIDPGDKIHDRLVIWIDANQNGISEPSELHSLRDVVERAPVLRQPIKRLVTVR